MKDTNELSSPKNKSSFFSMKPGHNAVAAVSCNTEPSPQTKRLAFYSPANRALLLNDTQKEIALDFFNKIKDEFLSPFFNNFDFDQASLDKNPEEMVDAKTMKYTIGCLVLSSISNYHSEEELNSLIDIYLPLKESEPYPSINAALKELYQITHGQAAANHRYMKSILDPRFNLQQDPNELKKAVGFHLAHLIHSWIKKELPHITNYLDGALAEFGTLIDIQRTSNCP